MKNLAIARRYAKALLLIGKEDGQAETYRKELDRFARLVAGQKDLEAAITNPLFEAAARRRVLEQIIAKQQLAGALKSFLLLLFDKKRFGFLSSINEFYQKLADSLKGIERASLVSATELSSETIEKIRSTLSRRTGKEILLDVKQDPSLIGGIVTKIGDLVLDGSIKTQFTNMSESLRRGERA